MEGGGREGGGGGGDEDAGNGGGDKGGGGDDGGGENKPLPYSASPSSSALADAEAARKVSSRGGDSGCGAAGVISGSLRRSTETATSAAFALKTKGISAFPLPLVQTKASLPA